MSLLEENIIFLNDYEVLIGILQEYSSVQEILSIVLEKLSPVLENFSSVR